MKVKFPYSIQRSMIKILPFIATAIMSASCQKEHDVVIDWAWDAQSLASSKKMIQKEINKKNVNMVFLNFGEMNLTSWNPAGFHKARDTLQTRLDIAPGRVRGMGTIYVASDNGAHLPDVTERITPGMALEDSIWYTANGWNVRRLYPQKEK